VKVGDLVVYGPKYRATATPDDNTYNVPGIIIKVPAMFENIVVVQWLDWTLGTLANEDSDALEVLGAGR
tara:strand:+ start:59 stop:265 length:207 start_codon:yes stop_codon:yes gene_type:complete